MTEFKLTTLKPSKTEAIRFKGRIIAETEWDTRAGEYMRFEIWETQGGAYIAVIEGSVPGNREKLISAEVVEPIYRDDMLLVDGKAGDQFQHIAGVQKAIDRKAMHIAVMRFFEFHDRARSMVRPLKWNTLREVA